jgi:hypothetical protein
MLGGRGRSDPRGLLRVSRTARGRAFTSHTEIAGATVSQGVRSGILAALNR